MCIKLHIRLLLKSKVIVDTIGYVESDLIERDIEARLVVLGMISKEHVLFIGPPGTSSKLLVFFFMLHHYLAHFAFILRI